jgi:hypothetical protein
MPLPEPTICDAWIAPNGTQHFVPPCGHDSVALHKWHVRAYDLERKGYIHLSLFAMGYIVTRDRFEPTNAQIDTMYDLWMLAQRMMGAHPGARRMHNATNMFRDLFGGW